MSFANLQSNFVFDQGKPHLTFKFSVGGNGLGFRDPAWEHRVVGSVSCQSGGASVDISFPEDYTSAKMPIYVRVLDKCNAKLCVANLGDECTHVGCVEVAADVHVPIFDRCLSFTCTCRYVMNGVISQLKPCRFAAAVLELDAFSEVDLFCLTGVCRGFLILDVGFDQSYFCKNYASITDPVYTKVMTDNLKRELTEGKVSKVQEQPTCVHALGAVEKKDGGLRPITDCKRPIGMSINSYMETTANTFKFHSIDDAVSHIKQGSYCAVSDISSAYRSVSVYQGWGNSNM